MFAAMNRKIYAITLLLSFMVVFGHMMIPHHHHESFEVEFSGSVSNHSHTHNGEHYHSHHEEESENQHEEHSDQNFPQHFHLSSSDDIELVRLNCSWTQDYKQVNQNLISSELFIHTFFEPPIISGNAYTFFEIPSNPQFKPQANSLRGPPTKV